MKNNKAKIEKRKKSSNTGLGIALGVSFGFILGLLFFDDNYGAGIGIGVALGLVIGSIMDARKQIDNDEYLLSNKELNE